MILPTKHIPSNQALIGVGALLLENLDRPRTVSDLWGGIKDNTSIGTFERFILGLDFLYVIGAVRLSEGMLRRIVQ